MTIFGIHHSGGCLCSKDYCSRIVIGTDIDEDLSLYLTEDLAKFALKEMANEGKFTLNDNGDDAIKYINNYCPMMQAYDEDEYDEEQIVQKDEWDGNWMEELYLIKLDVKES